MAKSSLDLVTSSSSFWLHWVFITTPRLFDSELGLSPVAGFSCRGVQALELADSVVVTRGAL